MLYLQPFHSRRCYYRCGSTYALVQRVYCKLLLGGLLSLGLANMAHAGNSACSRDVQSTGLYFIGSAVAKETWTVWASTTANGAFTQIFETVEQDPAYYDVKPPKAGTYFFRAWVDNTSSKPGYYDLEVTGAIGAVAPLSGSNTATLGPQGNSCAQFATGPAQRIGQSNLPVLWYLREFDGDGNFIGTGNSVTTADVNNVVQPGPGGIRDRALRDEYLEYHGHAVVSVSQSVSQ